MGAMVCEPPPVTEAPAPGEAAPEEAEAEEAEAEAEAVVKPQPVERIMGRMRAPLPRDKKEQGLKRLPIAEEGATQEETQ